MSHFSATLNRLLNGRTQAEIAQASGIPRSSIAQYSTDDRGISVDALGQLIRAFPDPEDQLDLVRAHLRDEIPAEVFDAISIHTSTSRVREDPNPSPWKKDLDAALDLIRVRAEVDEDVRTVIIDLQKIL